MKHFKSLLLYALMLGLTCSTAFACNPTAKEAPADKKGEIIHLTKAEFLSKVFNYEKNPDKWVYEGNLPCIVDFYADWCGPCKAISPILAELSEQYKGKIIIYKINVDKEKELAGTFGIQSIPSILFIPKNGKPTMSLGAMSKEDFTQNIEKLLLKTLR